MNVYGKIDEKQEKSHYQDWSVPEKRWIKSLNLDWSEVRRNELHFRFLVWQFGVWLLQLFLSCCL